MPRKRSSVLVANLSGCPYDLVADCCTELGYEVNKDEDAREYNLWFTATGVSRDRVKAMRGYQRTNHFPGMMELCRKDDMARHLNAMRVLRPQEYDFYPTTYVLPLEWRHFNNAASAATARTTGRKRTWIIKPQAGHGGRGIYLATSGKDVDQGAGSQVAQEYLADPLLVDGHKIDLRVYVLVLSVTPLRVMLYEDGLVRVCTEKYARPHPTNMANTCMHLTNYAINKKSAKFEQNRSASGNGSSSTSSSDGNNDESVPVKYQKKAVSSPKKPKTSGRSKSRNKDRKADTNQNINAELNQVTEDKGSHKSFPSLTFHGSKLDAHANIKKKGNSKKIRAEPTVAAAKLSVTTQKVDMNMQTQAQKEAEQNSQGEKAQVDTELDAEAIQQDGKEQEDGKEHESSNDKEEEETGHKRSIRWLLRRIAATHADGPEAGAAASAQLWSSIGDVIVKALIAVTPTVAAEYRSCRRYQHAGAFSCFELLGFDLMVDQDLRPWLIEVNHTPSWYTDSPLDLRVKRGVLREALRLAGATPDDRRHHVARCQEQDHAGSEGADGGSAHGSDSDTDDGGDSSGSHGRPGTWASVKKQDGGRGYADGGDGSGSGCSGGHIQMEPDQKQLLQQQLREQQHACGFQLIHPPPQRLTATQLALQMPWMIAVENEGKRETLALPPPRVPGSASGGMLANADLAALAQSQFDKARLSFSGLFSGGAGLGKRGGGDWRLALTRVREQKRLSSRSKKGAASKKSKRKSGTKNVGTGKESNRAEETAMNLESTGGAAAVAPPSSAPAAGRRPSLATPAFSGASSPCLTSPSRSNSLLRQKYEDAIKQDHDIDKKMQITSDIS